jgi:alpha-glucosidase
MKNRLTRGIVRMTVVAVGGLVAAGAVNASEAPAVIPPPESFFALVADRDLESARGFYRKYIDADGMPIAASGEVADAALQRGHEMVTRMLAGRPDIIKAMVDTGMYVVIIGKDQVYTDIPEYRNRPNPEYLNERVRGTGGKPTSFGEENILSLPIDRYDDESIAVHEFAHTIDRALQSIDPEWLGRLRGTYRRAIENGLYRKAYTASNAAEYWAESVQGYFDCNRVNNWNHGPIGTREQLRRYDPEGYELVRSTFNLAPEQDWRYRYLQALPNIIAPPASFQIDDHYTKFTYARELPVVGRGASDESLLVANDVIRKMFAYRHDILKIFINGGAKVVVLGEGERLSDLPEHRIWQEMDGYDPLLRMKDYCPRTHTFVVSEENLLASPGEPLGGDHQLIATLARAIYSVSRDRPAATIDPALIQQYELNVARIDLGFGAKVDELFSRAGQDDRWRGTAAVHSAEDYWAKGVLAYFEAAGQDIAPADATTPITTRAALRDYDPALWEWVHETMAFHGRVDWRLSAAGSAGD